jgi:pimeloyl-ACP methyl ester carboxylesterase
MEGIVKDSVLIKGYRVAYGVHGEGEPVVLLHGTPASSLIWRKVVPQLVERGYKVHVFDLLGYGLSERPWDPAVDTSISGQVPILEELLKHWRLDTTHIVAHDFGGGIAMRFALTVPNRTRTLTLIDVVSFDSFPSKRTRQQMRDGLEEMIKVPESEHRDHFREWLQSAVYDTSKFEAIDTLLGYISGPIGQASLFQHQIRHYDPKHTMEISHRLQELGNLPVQIVWGAKDEWQVVDWAHKLHKSIPNSRLHIIDQCGHFSPEEQPDRISSLVLQHLSEH